MKALQLKDDHVLQIFMPQMLAWLGLKVNDASCSLGYVHVFISAVFRRFKDIAPELQQPGRSTAWLYKS